MLFGISERDRKRHAAREGVKLGMLILRVPVVVELLAVRARDAGIESGAACEDLRRRFFMTGAPPWPETYARVEAGRPADLRRAVLAELEPRLEAASDRYPAAARAAWEALHE